MCVEMTLAGVGRCWTMLDDVGDLGSSGSDKHTMQYDMLLSNDE